MPRKARLELPGIPVNVAQRGVNRCAIFLDDQDRHHHRRLLRETCRKHGVAVHAFVLMDNHVHLLLSAGQSGRIALAMRTAGQAHVQAVNSADAAVRYGKDVSSPVWSTPIAICWPWSATWSSIRYAPRWWCDQEAIDGRASMPTSGKLATLLTLHPL